MLIEILKMLGLTILQNASFTLVSRARNSGSLWYNAGASVVSNGMWILVARQAVLSNDWYIIATYIVGATIGSVLMQWVAMRFLEKNKKK
jgi:hypothetical protein